MKKFDVKKRVDDNWLGAIRHRFTLNGYEAEVIEPPDPDPAKRWFWLPEWPDSYPERNGVKDLLALGYYMLHINVFGLFANEDALRIMRNFYDYVRSLGFHPKGAFIGMSLGGLYSFRFVQNNPETAACIYADAPVCDLNFNASWAESIAQAYGLTTTRAIENNPLSPVNNYDRMVKADIPILMILGNDDQVVIPQTNGELLAARYAAAGGRITVIRREYWGHHPHGLDHTEPIIRFILRSTMQISQ